MQYISNSQYIVYSVAYKHLTCHGLAPLHIPGYWLFRICARLLRVVNPLSSLLQSAHGAFCTYMNPEVVISEVFFLASQTLHSKKNPKKSRAFLHHLFIYPLQSPLAHVHVCTHTHTHMEFFWCTSTPLSTYVCTCVCVFMCICMCMYVYVYVYVCTCVCVCMHRCMCMCSTSARANPQAKLYGEFREQWHFCLSLVSE